jgi:hypothetical protein
MIRGLNLPGTPRATSACRGTPLLYFTSVFKKCRDGSQFPSLNATFFMQTARFKFTIKPAAMEANISSSQIIHFPCNQLQGIGFLAYSVFHMSETGRYVGPQVYPAEVYKDAVSLSPIGKVVILSSK